MINLIYGQSLLALLISFLYKYKKYREKDLVLLGLILGLSFIGLEREDYFYRLIFISLAYIDLKEHRIPNRILLLGLVYWILFDRSLSPTMTYYGFISLGLLVGLLVLSLATGQVGMGDVKLLGLVLLVYGPTIFLSLFFLSLILLFFYSIFLLVGQGKEGGYSIAYGPFLGLALIYLGV